MSSVVKQQATQQWHARSGSAPGMASTLPPLRLSGDAVVGRAIVPQDLPFIRLADIELQKTGDRLGELRVAVGEVSGEDQAVATAEVLNGVLHRFLIGLRRGEALALPVSTGGHRELRRMHIA